MTGFRDMSRIKKVWEQSTQYFRRMRSQDLTGNTDKQAEEVIQPAPLWKRKSTIIIGGVIILLTTSGFIGNDQYNKYIERNTFPYYHVYIDGKEVGTVAEANEVEAMVAAKTKALQDANPGINMVLETGEITYELDKGFKFVPETEATLAEVESNFNSYAIGVEVKVDGKVIGVVKDQETADAILARVQSKYAPEIAAAGKNQKSVSTLSFDGKADAAAADEAAADPNEPGVKVTNVEFVEQVAVQQLNTKPDDIQEAEDVYKKIVDGSTKPTKYVVQAGDVIGRIALKFDISPQVIYDNNPWIEGDRITVGDELDLTVLQPELTVRTTEQHVDLEKIAAPVEYVTNDQMRVGENKTIKEGTEGSQRLTYEIVKENGYLISETLLEKVVLTEPTATVIEKGTMVVLGEGTGRFMVPVKNYRVTSKFGPRWGRNHNGVDFTGNKNIMAADNGVVEFVGRKEGLGNTIIIDHKNGYKTVYGHLSSYKVSSGDKVEKGDYIGIMGSTGNSTGVHLHLEIHKNGVIQNPLKYL